MTATWLTSLRLKYDVFHHYFGPPPWQCLCCEESNFRFLVLDDVSGDGQRLRAHARGGKVVKNGGGGGRPLYQWLIKHDFPMTITDDQGKFALCFQPLCTWCNGAKGKKGRCPLHGQPHDTLSYLLSTNDLPHLTPQN